MNTIAKVPHTSQEASETVLAVPWQTTGEALLAVKGGAGHGHKKDVDENPEPWRRIRFWGIVRLVELEPFSRRWRWLKTVRKKGPVLQLVSPRGVRWDFRLNRGAWIRRAREEKHVDN